MLKHEHRVHTVSLDNRTSSSNNWYLLLADTMWSIM